jgi:hypothetical protein
VSRFTPGAIRLTLPASGDISRTVRILVAVVACVAVLAVVLVPALQLTSTIHVAGHHASLKSRGTSPVGQRAVTTATATDLPHPLLAGRAPMLEVAGPALDCSQEPFVPPRA